MEKKDLEELIICQCANVEHQMIFSAEAEDESDWVFVSIHLAPLPFWKRLWHGIKYIFGYRSRYGDFDEIILDSRHIEKLENVVKFMKENTILKNELTEKWTTQQN